MSGGEPVGPTVFHWARDELGVTVNEIFGQTEMNYIVGNSHDAVAGEAGLDGAALSRPSHRGDRRRRQRAAAGRGGRRRGAPHRARRHARPGVLPRLLGQPRRRRATKFTGDWCRTGDDAPSATRTATSGTRGAPTTCSRAPATASVPSEIENCLVKHRRSPTPRSCPRPTRRAATSSRRSSCSPPGACAVARARGRHPRARARPARALPVPARDRVHRRAADDDDRQGAAARAARAGEGAQGGKASG